MTVPIQESFTDEGAHPAIAISNKTFHTSCSLRFSSLYLNLFTGGFNLAGAAAQAGQHVAFGATGQNPATSGTTSFNFGNTPGSTAPAGQGQ